MSNEPSLDLLTIDPGFRYAAVAGFSDGSVVTAALLKAKSQSDWDRATIQPPDFSFLKEYVNSRSWQTRNAIIEVPKILRSTPNAEDILKLMGACGAYTAILQDLGFKIAWVKPRAWKGTAPKEIMTKRIVAKLTEIEYNSINRTKDHNILDAVGIGLWQLKRL